MTLSTKYPPVFKGSNWAQDLRRQGKTWKWNSLSHIQLFANPWTIQSTEFSRPEYWSGIAFPFSRGSFQPRDRTRPPTLQADSLPAEPQGKPKNTGLGSLSLLQQIFPTQELNQNMHCRHILYQLGYQGNLVRRHGSLLHCLLSLYTELESSCTNTLAHLTCSSPKGFNPSTLPGTWQWKGLVPLRGDAAWNLHQYDLSKQPQQGNFIRI